MKDGKFQANGNTYWYINGQFHREDGPAVEYSNGGKYWYQHGLRHRDSGPAIERSDGSKEWFDEGKPHRIDGPAIESADSSKRWYLEGKQVTEEEFNLWRMKKELNDKLNSTLTPKSKIKRSKI